MAHRTIVESSPRSFECWFKKRFSAGTNFAGQLPESDANENVGGMQARAYERWRQSCKQGSLVEIFFVEFDRQAMFDDLLDHSFSLRRWFRVCRIFAVVPNRTLFFGELRKSFVERFQSGCCTIQVDTSVPKHLDLRNVVELGFHFFNAAEGESRHRKCENRNADPKCH